MSTSIVVSSEGSKVNWIDVSSNIVDAEAGNYNFKTLSGNLTFKLDLTSEIGSEWEFANSDYTIMDSSREVKVGLPTDSFQNETGIYELGELVINVPNAHVKIVKVASDKYDVIFDGVVDNVSTGTTQTFLKSQSGKFSVPFTQGNVLSNTIIIPFNQTFDNIPEVVLDYNWNFNASTNPTSLDPELHLEGVTQGSFTVRLNGNTNVLDTITWIAHDNNKIQQQVLDPNMTSVNLGGLGENLVFDMASSGIKRKQPVFYSGFWEVDQVFQANVVTEWSLSTPTRQAQSGIGVNGNLLTVTEDGMYEIHIGGGVSNNSGNNSVVSTSIQTNSTGTFQNIASTSFKTVEIDGVGSQSGGGIACSAIIQLSTGQQFRVVTNGTQSSIALDKSITIKKIY